MRLIDADKLFEDFEDKVFSLRTGDVESAIVKMSELVNNAPTVDAVPVVRCKDCVYCWKFNDKFYLPKKDSLICVNDCDSEVHADDFCSWGERRDDGQADQP